jgi:hypothetical protein
MVTTETKPTYVGSYFTELFPEGNYYQDGKILKYSDEGYKIVGILPFIPTFYETKSSVSGTWFNCFELSEAENRELELSDTHWSWDIYVTNVNEKSPFNWVGYFFRKFVAEKR